MDTPPVVYPFICWWALGLFLLFGFMHNAVVNICVHVLCRCMISFLLGMYLGMELLDHMVTVCFTFWQTIKLFSRVAVLFYMRVPVPTASPTFVLFVFLIQGAAHCGFDLHFPSGR